MDYLPIFINLREQPCLVVGGGTVAARKVLSLQRAGARVTVLSPECGEAVERLGSSVTVREKAFTADDVTGFQLVVAATDRPEVNAAVAAAAKTRNIPVNIVDCPDLSSFIFPVIIDRSPVIAALSSGGRSPVLLRLLRTRLETVIPANFGRLAELAGRFRTRVRQTIAGAERRRAFWQEVLQGPVAELVSAGRVRDAERTLDRALHAEVRAGNRPGAVYLVGAGPGDPDLLTLRALRLIQQADVVVYDRLVTPQVLALIRPDAEKIYAGKERSRHTMPQEAINDLLARLAESGKVVVRLKGGDPFIFGRGGEEIENLMEAGIFFQVVPGITAASGCAAYAGIPLTHRDHAHSCMFITGHVKQGVIDLDWKQLTDPRQTLVIYMGLLGLEQVCRALIRHGRSPDTPAALIQQGTTQQQRVLTGSLQTLPRIVAAAAVKAPTLVIVGSVVTLHDRLAWFQETRAPEQP